MDALKQAQSFKIVLRMQMRDDGGLRVWSDDVPGLVLSHSDPAKVLEDIKPALETILSEAFGCDVEARPLGKLPAFLESRPSKTPKRRERPARPETPIYARRKTLEYAALPCG